MTEEKSVHRSLPQSLEAEQSVIGAMIIDSEAIQIASEILSPEDFFYEQNRIIYETIIELYNEGKNVDGITLKDCLKKKSTVAQPYDLNDILRMAAYVPSSSNVKYYAEIVSEKSTLRKLIHTCGSIINRCYSEQPEIQNVMDETKKEIFAITQARSSEDFEPISSVVMNALNRIESASKLQGTVTGHATGFSQLDYTTAGFQPSDLIIIAARPSMGKTAFVLNIAQHMAIHDKKTVAIFSLEMSDEQLIKRMMSMESQVSSELLRSGKLSDSEWEKVIYGADMIGSSHLIIDGKPGMSVQELQAKCRKYKREKNLQIVMIDYLQLMTGGGKHSAESVQQEITEISRSLKGLARELNVPVIALSQLSREVEKRPDHRPMMSDLRDSGAIEQDADMVMFIYRDDYYNKDSEDKGISEIIIAKQRNGPIGTVKLKWLPELTKFEDMDSYSDDI
ncbi:replicative DNA helicase [Butyrivibrio sp. ob235]|uniref:replicative DNA helicase n=1 Tax=Butyrivibrio sp. ob235 TaxID=1761780 RepID=UPI0008C0671C|nr:replicative DNA helicase [Butyrivibrio sp. ob235]SEM02057.1 replicative DNA helicase [Butyrivibrio sp. ob235]